VNSVELYIRKERLQSRTMDEIITVVAFQSGWLEAEFKVESFTGKRTTTV
jgi:hypothetical protein